jgi:UTP-glucose-1-phosphate uridylyltransferase
MSNGIKALIPAAGQGKRLSHLSQGGHKELLTVGGLTMIEHTLDLVADSGVADVALVVRPGKETVIDKARAFWEHKAPEAPPLTILWQDPPRGVADAMALAESFAGNHPLAVIMPDNMLLGPKPALGRMIEVFLQCEDHVIGVIPLTPDKAGMFGNVGRMTIETGTNGPPRVLTFSPKGQGMLYTDGQGQYYKGLTGVIYLPGWAERIKNLTPNLENEIDDTDIVMDLVREKRLYAAILEGQGFDLGNEKGLTAARQAIESGGTV